MVTTTKATPIRLQAAARLSKLTEEEILEQAAARRVPLAVWAHNWIVCDGKLSEATQQFEPSGQSRVLRDAFLYLDWGYARKFIRGEEDRPLYLGMYRSTRRGAVDVWAKAKNPAGKPALRRADLWVHMSDVEQARRNIEKRSADRGLGGPRVRASKTAETKRDQTLQKLVVTMAVAKYGWKPRSRNPATGGNEGSIAADVERVLGADAAITADTIRSHLNRAAEKFLPNK